MFRIEDRERPFARFLVTNSFTGAYIRKVLDLLFEPGNVVELRCPKTRQGTMTGYFDDLSKLAEAASRLSGEVPAVYITANPVEPALLNRAVNRLESYGKETTTDKQVVRRRWFLLDLDPKRPSGISSADSEHDAAIKRAAAVKLWLETELEFPELVIADSGNGAHLLGRVDLPCTDETTTLFKKCIEAIALRFEDDAISVDRTVYNAARIWKLYGTLACKGDNTAVRPHRLARIIKAPRPVSIIPLEKLQQLAAMAPEEPKRDTGALHRHSFDIDAWIANSGLDVASSGTWQDGRKWILSVCPWNGDHTNRSAFIIEHRSGAIAAGCHHNGCSGKGWHDLRDVVEPDWREKRHIETAERETQPATSGPYRIEGGRIVRERMTKDGPVVESLCNFNAWVHEEVVLDDGAEATRAFQIQGKLENGSPLPSVRIAANRFAGMTWVTESWGMRTIVRAGLSVKDSLREAVQRLSPEPKLRRIFTHTGWRQIDGEWHYLSGSSAADGFEVDLGSELSRYKLPPVPDDPISAMRASLKLMELAPLRITAALWAACYRAPLVSALPQDLSLWLEGKTGSMKSTLAAVFISHFGDFDRLHLPGAWSSTANQLERRAFLLKDNLFVIDDYAPSALDHRELETKAGRILRSQGNNSGRARLKADLSERAAFPPRGIIISTGEQHPPGQSLLARTLIMELDREAIDINRLTQAQQLSCRLPYAMAGYIQWLRPQSWPAFSWLEFSPCCALGLP
jgi:hypothetical protein